MGSAEQPGGTEVAVVAGKAERPWNKLTKLATIHILSILGSICSICSFFLVMIFRDSGSAWVYLASQGVLMLSLVGFAIYLSIQRERGLAALGGKDSQIQRQKQNVLALKERLTKQKAFSASYVTLHKIFHDLRDALIELAEIEDDAAKDHEVDRLFLVFMQKATDNLQRIFDATADEKSRVCIKQLIDDGKNVKTLCRDAGCSAEHSEEPVPVEANTDFLLVSQRAPGHKRFFFCNDLMGLGCYQNSHPDWKSKYLSAIVWPIRGPKLGSPGNYDVAGFLCVDSMQTNVFDPVVSVEIGAAVADMLYILLVEVDSIKEDAGQV